MITRGYGSFDYVPIEYRSTDVVKVDILVNKEPIDALAYLVHRDKARARALHYCEQLAEAIPDTSSRFRFKGRLVEPSLLGLQSNRTVKMSRQNYMVVM